MTPEPLRLTDEELAVLAPAAGPLPHLDRCALLAAEAALRTAARSLLVRGVGELDDGTVVPVPGLVALVAPLEADLPQLHLACPLPGADTTLTVLRRLADGRLHVHDVSEDGVHELSLQDGEGVREQLRGVLDPLGVVEGLTAAPSEPDLLRPDAAVRLRLVARGSALEHVVATAGGRCWRVPPDGGPAVVLDGPALEALVDALLVGLVAGAA